MSEHSEQQVGEPVVESAMDSGSDAGTPGERHVPEAAADGQAVEDRPEAVSAVDDDAPLPSTGGAGSAPADEVTPEFREP